MNTNAKHSPAPWRIIPHKTMQEDHGGETVEIEFMAIESDADMIAEIFPVYRPDPNEATLSKTANARLIASSPALLDALKNAVSYLEANRPKGKIREIFTQLNEYENGVLKPARAAIAQAEGGAQ
jgi:hypothetical protein